MISNIEKGNSFRGCLDYNFKEGKGTLIGGNMAGQNAQELSAEFGAVRRHNQQCTRPVFHASLSSAPGEHLTDQEWNEAASDYMKKMGFDDNQYCVFRHTDTDSEHIHIVANRIKTTDLSVVHDSNDRHRSHTACREIEAAQGLQSGEKGHSNTDKGYCADLKKGVDKSIRDCKGDKSKFVECCKKNGIEARLNIQSTGRISGVSYSKPGGKEIKGSALGHGYKYGGIEKRIGQQQEHKAGKHGGVGKDIAAVASKAGGQASKIIRRALEM